MILKFCREDGDIEVSNKTVEVQFGDQEDSQQQNHRIDKRSEIHDTLDMSIALRKGTKLCTQHPLCNFVYY